jgi:MFS family permease
MYSFNNPQALQDSITKELQISPTQFNMLYTIIALPNIFFPIIVGVIIDYLGIRMALVVLTFAAMVFQTVVALGASNLSFETMLVGRMFFGIAVESLGVVQTCFVSYWFLGK